MLCSKNSLGTEIHRFDSKEALSKVLKNVPGEIRETRTKCRILQLTNDLKLWGWQEYYSRMLFLVRQRVFNAEELIRSEFDNNYKHFLSLTQNNVNVNSTYFCACGNINWRHVVIPVQLRAFPELCFLSKTHSRTYAVWVLTAKFTLHCHQYFTSLSVFQSIPPV